MIRSKKAKDMLRALKSVQDSVHDILETLALLEWDLSEIWMFLVYRS